MEQAGVTLSMERELLGCFIHHSDLYRVHAHEIKPSYLRNESHANILTAIGELITIDFSPDIFTIKHHLKLNKADKVTISLFDQLNDTRLSHAVIKNYIYHIKKEYSRIKLLSTVLEVSALCETELADLKPALNLIDTTVNMIENIHSSGVCSSFSEVLKMVNHDRVFTRTDDQPINWFSHSLNKIINGLEPGELTVVAARPGIGKTAFALSQVFHLLKQNIPVIYVSTEHNRTQLAFRLISMHGNINAYHDFVNEHSEEKLAHIKQLMSETENWPIDLIEAGSMRIHRLIRICRQRQMINGARLIVFDNIQQLVAGKDDQIRDMQIGHIVSQLKRLALSLNIPVLSVSQLNRLSDRRGMSAFPIMSDLRESGYIESVADKVILMYRADYYGITEDEFGASTKNVADVIVAKNRNGRSGNTKLKLFMPALRFEDVVVAPISETTTYDHNYDYEIPPNRLNELTDE
jgi:replicative DNA helicase